MIGAVLAELLGAALLVATVGAQDPVEREWSSRAWALRTVEHSEEIDRALASLAWTDRHLALDALARTGRSARSLLDRRPDAILAGIEDPQPNVRAMAWGVLAAAGVLTDPVRQRLDAALEDPYPGVQEALVELAARRPEGLDERERRQLLADLSTGRGRTADLARRLLLQEGVGAGAYLASLFDGPEGLPELVVAWPHLLRASIDPELVAHLRGLGGGAGPDALAIGVLAEVLALHGEIDLAMARAAGMQEDLEVPLADRAILAAGWTAGPEDDDPRDPFLRQRWENILRDAAAEGDRELGSLLLQAALREAKRDPTAARTELVVECAALAADVSQAIEATVYLPEELAGIVWRFAGPRLQSVNTDAAAFWLDVERGDEIRFAVASSLAEIYTRTGDPATEGLITGLLLDRDSGLRRASFRWLCDGPRFDELEPRLFEAWTEYEPDEQWIQLRSLPRGRPLNLFGAALLELAGSPESRRAELLELLGAQPDPAVHASLRRWLEEELAGLAAASDAEAYARHEGRSIALGRALSEGPGNGQDGAPSPVNLDALAAAVLVAVANPPDPAWSGRDPELPKLLIARLGRTRAGRARIATFLDRSFPSRAAIETAIQLCRGEPVPALAVDVLIGSYEGCDTELAIRILEALGRAGTARSYGFIGTLALRPRLGIARRLAAIRALSRPGGETILGEVVRTVGESDAGVAAVTSLAELDSDAATEQLLDLWSSDPPPVLRAELMVALASRGEFIGTAAWLEYPMAAGATDLRGRFAGELRATVEFRWDGELRTTEVLARRGELEEALAAAEGLERLDAELLMSLSGRALSGGDPRAGTRLAEFAHVAYLGEGEADDRTADRRFESTARRLDAAFAAGELDLALDAARELAAAFRLDRPRGNRIEESLGVFDRRTGLDPAARVEVLAEQLRAALALEAGGEAGRAEAARILGATRSRSQASLRAAELQARLEGELDG